MNPANGSRTADVQQAISVRIADSGGSGVNPASLKLTLTYGGAPHEFTTANPGLKWYPGEGLVYFEPAACDPPVTFPDGAVACKLEASDNAGNAANALEWTFEVDTSGPTFASVEYFLDAELTQAAHVYDGASYAKAGPLYLKVTSAEALNEPPVVNILRDDENSVFDLPSLAVSGTVFVATYNVPADGYVGNAAVYLWGRDAGTLNAPAAAIAPDAGGSFKIDTVAPAVTGVTLTSGGNPVDSQHVPKTVGALRIAAAFSEALDNTAGFPTVKLSLLRGAGTYIAANVAMQQDGDAQHWRADVALADEADGAVAIVISDGLDHAGNENTTAAVGSLIHVDAESPVFAEITVSPALASSQAGYNTVQISFRANEPVDVDTLTVTVGGAAATLAGSTHGNTRFVFEYAVTGEEAEGEAEVAISGEDLAGNTGNASATVTFDFTAPTITVTQPAGAELEGEEFELTWTWNDVNGIATGQAQVLLNGEDVTAQCVLTAFGGSYRRQ